MSGSQGQGPEEGERFTEEELRVVRSAGLFDTYLGRGWFRNLIIYGTPTIAALLIAAGIFSSLIEVSETLLIYSQEAWISGARTGARVAVMDRDGEFVPVTDLTMTLHDGATGRSAVLHDGEAHGTKAASLTLDVPDWGPGRYDLEVHARTTRRPKRATLHIELDPAYRGDPPDLTRELRAWRNQFGSADFMQPGSGIRVDIVAEGGQVASSLPNILYVRTTAPSGAPLASRVRLGLAEGYLSGELPEFVETDSLGLASLIVYPTFNVLVLEVEAVALQRPTAAPVEASSPVEQAVPEPPQPAGRGRIILPIGPQGIRLRPLVPNPAVGEAVRLRVYSVGSERVLFMDLLRHDVWIGAAGTTVDAQSSEVQAPAARSAGLHVVQAYTSPVPAYYERLPGREPELASSSISAAHLWVRDEAQSDLDTLANVAAELQRRGVDGAYVRHLTDDLLGAGGFNEGQAIAFLLARLDGAVYPPDVSASSRESDKSSASSLQGRIKGLVVVSFSIVSLIMVLAFGFLTLQTWRAARTGRTSRTEPPAETPISSQDPGWLRKQVFQMSMIIAVVVGTFGLLAVLVMYLRWTIG